MASIAAFEPGSGGVCHSDQAQLQDEQQRPQTRPKAARKRAFKRTARQQERRGLSRWPR